MDWFYGQIVGFLGNFFAYMANMGVELFELEWVSAIILFFFRLAWALFAVSVVVCAFECGIEYSTGRGNLRQCGLNIIKGFLAVSLFTVVPVRLYALSVSLQGTFSAGLTGYGRSIGEVGQDIITELSEIQTLADVVNSSHFGLDMITSPIMLLFCIILMAYAVLKVFSASLKRGGILPIQIAVGSLYMFSIPRGDPDGFTGWMRQVIGLCLTAFLQSTIYSLSQTACLGILRRADCRGKSLPPLLEAALRMQAGLDPPTPILGEAKAYHINQRNEGIDLDGVSGARMATQNIQMQTFIAGFSAGAGASAGTIGYQEGVSPTLKGSPSGNCMPSILCINDQGGQVMECSENITGTLRAQEHGHQPLVLRPMGPTVYENYGIDGRYAGPHEVAPTMSARYGTGGNNIPLMQREEVICIAGNAIDRQPQNGGNGIGCQRDISYSCSPDNMEGGR